MTDVTDVSRDAPGHPRLADNGSLAEFEGALVAVDAATVDAMLRALVLLDQAARRQQAR